MSLYRTVQMVNPDFAGSTLQLSGSRTYTVDGEGKVTIDRRNYLELMNLGFWPVTQGTSAGTDSDPGDLIPVLNALLNQGL